MKRLLSIVAVVLLTGCGGGGEAIETTTVPETSAVETTVAAPAGQDVTAEVEAYIAPELEAGSLAEACQAGTPWVCNVEIITLADGVLTVTLSQTGETTLQGVAMGFRNFLQDGPVSFNKVTAVTGGESASVETL